MKNKLQKTNMTRFDHKARKLGIIGIFMMVATFAVCIPVATNIINNNNQVTVEIQKLQTEQEEPTTTYTIERK
jgi:hypothetical protein